MLFTDLLFPEDCQDSVNDLGESSDDATCSEKYNMTLKQGESEVDLPYHEDVVIVNPDDLLPPVVKLEKYASNDIVFNRQAVVRNLLETLRGAIGNQDEVNRIITVMCNLSEDYEPSVRAELMEQIPHLAALCKDNCYHLGNLIKHHLVPMIIKYLADINNQVRKRTQATLLIMVEQGVIDKGTLEEKICPLVLQLTESSHLDDHRTEAVTLMSKLSTLIGKEATERLFSERFAMLSMDTSFHVRKVCASSFGDFCNVVGREATEEKLLQKFFSLCEDGVWGVRKACAEVFMPVSCVCSMETRHKQLAPLYMKLLCDQSRWVRTAAFQALGPFISTFAEPNKTGLYYSKDGVLTVVDVPGNRTSDESSFNGSLVSSLNNSDSDSICRTNLASNNKCDIPVPSYRCESNSSPTPTEDETNYHSSTYCTVIEVTSPSSGEVTTKVSNQDINRVICSEAKTDSQNLSSPSQTEDASFSDHVEAADEENDHLWHQCLYANVASEVIISNGEVVDELEVHNASSLLPSDTDDLGKSTLCLNDIDKGAFAESSDMQHAEKAEVTVSGIAIYSEKNWEYSSYSLGHQEVSDLCNAAHNSTRPVYISSHTAVHINGILNESPEDNSACASESMVNSEHSIQNSLPGENVSNNVPEAAAYFDDPALISNHSKPDDDIPDSNECESQGDDESAFNHFQYWRMPIPDVDIDIKVEDCQSAGSHHTSSCDIKMPVHVISSSGELSRDRDVPITTWSSISSSSCSVADAKNTHDINRFQDYSLLQGNKMGDDTDTIGHRDGQTELNRTYSETFHGDYDRDGEPPPTSQQYISAHDQDIIPPDLLLRYLSMTDASRAQTVDAEIARHCAYSLPAVALTLGRKYWPCLKETYDTLASDMQGFIMQWKVRRTLASSMHQLAVILGPDIAAQDLLPVFSGFVKDLDEVRIGILQHLSEFLVVLHTEGRRQFLPRISEFLHTDNEKNWRFRLILAEQLIPTADLYDPDDVREHLVPLSLALVRDKVSEVRLMAVKVMAAMMRRMSQSSTSTLTKSVLTELAEQFIHAPKWLYRQVYVYMCQEFIKGNSLPSDQFGEDAMPHLLYLCWDRVANVRLAIARCLAVYVWPLENFSHPDSPHRDLLLQALHTLQSDMDMDVRHYANMVATHECSCLQHGSLKDMNDPPV